MWKSVEKLVSGEFVLIPELGCGAIWLANFRFQISNCEFQISDLKSRTRAGDWQLAQLGHATLCGHKEAQFPVAHLAGKIKKTGGNFWELVSILRAL